MLRKLLNDELKTRARTNLVQSREFSELRESAIRKHRNRAVETAQVIEELIAIARQMREETHRGQELGLTDDEIACRDALEANDSAVAVLWDGTLRAIPRELV